MANPLPKSEPRPLRDEKPANKRGLSRLAAVQALYQMDVGGTGILETVAEYEELRLGGELDGERYREADAQWFRQTVSGVVENQKRLDPLIRQSLSEGWPLSRLDSLLRAIMRAGAWELDTKRDTPIGVTISEYVNVTKAFYADDEPKLVNAVLDRLARHFERK